MDVNLLFTICTTLVLPFWLALIFAPEHKLVKNLITIVAVILALVYASLVPIFLGIEEGGFGSLEEAKDAFWKANEELEIWFKENPKGKVKNTVFGWLDRYEFSLLSRKHWAHHLEQFGLG